MQSFAQYRPRSVFWCLAILLSISSGLSPALAEDTDRSRFVIKPGEPISITTSSREIRITNDAKLAREQAEEYPDSPEAHFVLAVALTRTSRVEDALKEVRTARKLSMAKGGASFFDEMISEYERVLEDKPEDNDIRYQLAWAYYMKAYVLTRYSRKASPSSRLSIVHRDTDGESGSNDKSQKSSTVESPIFKENENENEIEIEKKQSWHDQWVTRSLAEEKSDSGANTEASHQDGIEAKSDTASSSFMEAWRDAAPEAIPQIKRYYRKALKKLDDLLEREPEDLWAKLYRAHLQAEYSGDIDSAMSVWESCRKKHPSNPAPYFFLGEGYLKKGDLRQSISNVSKAVALRSLGN